MDKSTPTLSEIRSNIDKYFVHSITRSFVPEEIKKKKPKFSNVTVKIELRVIFTA